MIVSDRDQVKKLNIGYSDDVSVFLNGEILYRGRSAQRFRDPGFLGIVNAENDAVYLSLKSGENELVLEVSELTGGWGSSAALTTWMACVKHECFPYWQCGLHDDFKAGQASSLPRLPTEQKLEDEKHRSASEAGPRYPTFEALLAGAQIQGRWLDGFGKLKNRSATEEHEFADLFRLFGAITSAQIRCCHKGKSTH